METFGDETKVRGVRMWGLVGTRDLDGEITPNDSMKDYMDWFVSPVSMGGHGGPMNVNHTNKVVGHWNKWGTGTHPDTGKEAVYIEGVVHRGPNGEPFPNADKVWNAFKDGKVKGTSWGGTIMAESEHYSDRTGLKELVTNDKVQVYEWSLVMDWDGEEHNPAVPQATPIIYNDIAKETKEETAMTDEVKEEVIEEPVEEEVKEETFDMKKEFESFKSEVLSLIEKVKEGSGPGTPPERDDDEDDEKKETDDEEDDDDEKKETEDDEEDEKEKVTEIPDSWKEKIDEMVEEKLKAVTTVESTPDPPQKEVESVVEEEKVKEAPDRIKYLKMGRQLRIKLDREQEEI